MFYFSSISDHLFKAGIFFKENKFGRLRRQMFILRCLVLQDTEVLPFIFHGVSLGFLGEQSYFFIIQQQIVLVQELQLYITFSFP